jgi:hypothetical protein
VASDCCARTGVATIASVKAMVVAALMSDAVSTREPAGTCKDQGRGSLDPSRRIGGSVRPEGSLLEHFVDKPLLGNSQKEVFRELADLLIPRRRFERKLPDHRRR